MKKANLNNSKNLVITCQYYPPDFAATGQLIENLSNGLSEKNVKIKIFTSMPNYAFTEKDPPLREKKNNKLIIRSRISRIWKIKKGNKLVNGLIFSFSCLSKILFMNKNSTSLIITSAPPFLPLLFLALYKMRKFKFILVVYDIYPDVLINLKIFPDNFILFKCWKQLNNYIYKYASSIVVLTESMKKNIIANNDSIEKKVKVIPSWSIVQDIEPISKQNNWFAKKYDLVHKFVVMYSGNQGRNHDLKTLIESANNLKNYKDIVFCLIGDGPQNLYLKTLCKKLNLKNCIFLPYQEKDVLPFSFTSADLAIISINSEADGLIAPSKLYGHLAASNPICVISPKDSYLQKMIKKYKFGKWFENGNHKDLSDWIISLKDLPSYRDKFVRNSIECNKEILKKDDVVEMFFKLIND